MLKTICPASTANSDWNRKKKKKKRKEQKANKWWDAQKKCNQNGTHCEQGASSKHGEKKADYIYWTAAQILRFFSHMNHAN